MVSIPRDSFVPIPDHGEDKIKLRVRDGRGIVANPRRWSRPPDCASIHYAEIGFSGFAVPGGCPWRHHRLPTTTPDQRSVWPASTCPPAAKRWNGRNAPRLRQDSGHPPRADLEPDGQSAAVHLGAACCAAGARPVSGGSNPWRWYSVPHAAADALTVKRRRSRMGLGSAGLGAAADPRPRLTVPIAEFTSNSAGSVVVWNHDVAGKLFDALASDAPVPTARARGTSRSPAIRGYLPFIFAPAAELPQLAKHFLQPGRSRKRNHRD